MRLLFKIINLIIVLNLPLLAGDYSPPWGLDDAQIHRDDIIALYSLDNWIVDAAEERKTTLPFYSDTEDSLIFTNTFMINSDSIESDYMFFSRGFNGVFKIFINNNFIFEGPNGTAPFAAHIPESYLKPGSNSIKIILSKSAEIFNSFPIFTKLYTEPEYIGISRIFYLQPKNNLIGKINYSIEELDNKVKITYNYLLNNSFIKKHFKPDGVTLTEIIQDPFGREINRRTLNYTSTTSAIIGSINLNPALLWSPENPEKFKLILSLNRFGTNLKSQETDIAFRNISINNNTIFVNEKAGIIRGVNIYENLQLKSNFSIYAENSEHLKYIKNNGFNALRFINHLPDETFLDIADSLGLLVFIDMPVKRYPEITFKQDNLLENIKESINNVVSVFSRHPSFVAMGIGNEVMLSSSAVQKFFFILNTSIVHPFPFLTYISPLPEINVTMDKVADFYILDAYFSITGKESFLKESDIPYSLAGKAAFSNSNNYLNVNDLNFSLNKRILIIHNINSIINELGLQGGFFESFMDWHSRSLSHQSLPNKYVITNGLLDTSGTQYSWLEELGNPVWEPADITHLNQNNQDKSSNMFSIVAFFFAVFFLFFFNRYPRLSENYKRSLQHPYGFYVDLRERRIIPVFNSFVTGAHNSLILTIFVGSFIYYYNDSILLQEILATIFPSYIYNFIIEISQSKWLIIINCFFIFACYPLYVGLIVKVFGFIARKSIRIRQALAVGLWSGSPIIFLLPLSLFTYHILIKGGFQIYLLVILAVFLIWIQFRLINGIRVLLLVKFRSIFMLLLLSYSIPVVIFLLLFDHQPMWTDYLITLVNSHTLF